MGCKKSCIWYDETKTTGYGLCYNLIYSDTSVFIDSCPKNCKSYISRHIRDKELRQILEKRYGAGAE